MEWHFSYHHHHPRPHIPLHRRHRHSPSDEQSLEELSFVRENKSFLVAGSVSPSQFPCWLHTVSHNSLYYFFLPIQISFHLLIYFTHGNRRKKATSKRSKPTSTLFLCQLVHHHHHRYQYRHDIVLVGSAICVLLHQREIIILKVYSVVSLLFLLYKSP